jgi:hypothetical protein
MYNDDFKNNQGGFIQLIVLIIILLLVMRYFGITITGILHYFNLTFADILNTLKIGLMWLRDLFNSVR